jgi:hypothetical protein
LPQKKFKIPFARQVRFTKNYFATSELVGFLSTIWNFVVRFRHIVSVCFCVARRIPVTEIPSDLSTVFPLLTSKEADEDEILIPILFASCYVKIYRNLPNLQQKDRTSAAI